VIYIKACYTMGLQIQLALRGSRHQSGVEAIIGGCLGLILVGYPALNIVALRNAAGLYTHPNIQGQIGVLYEDLHVYKHVNNLKFIWYFLARRAVLVLIPTFISSNGLQIVLLLWSVLGYQIWYVHYQPHFEQRRTQLELINEVLTYICFLHLTLLSDFVVDNQVRYGYAFSCIFFICLFIMVNVGYIMMLEVERQQHKKRLLERRKAWHAFLKQRKEALKNNKINTVLNKNLERILDDEEPEKRKPKIQQLARVPKSYGKKVWVKPSGLPTIKEEQEEMEKEINEEIYKDLGTFGDIVELSRDQILAGYCRPRNMESPPRPKEIVEVEEVPEEIPAFDRTFEESKYARWEGVSGHNPAATLRVQQALPQGPTLIQEISSKVSTALSRTAYRTQKMIKTLTEISDDEAEDKSTDSEQWVKFKKEKTERKEKVKDNHKHKKLEKNRVTV
jgi:hypothetical protein